MTRTRRWYRSLLVAALVVLGLVVGQTAAVAAPFGARDPNCHLATWIQGLVDNRTSGSMVLAEDGLGVTNVWCREAGDAIRSRGMGSWRAGDDSGETSVVLVYLLQTGERVLFQARMPRGGPASVGCRFTDVPTPPLRYICEVETAMEGDNFAFVTFSVRPFGT